MSKPTTVKKQSATKGDMTVKNPKTTNSKDKDSGDKDFDAAIRTLLGTKK